jgi:hypothetical protein
MLSFATVAVTDAGEMLGEFEAVLQALPGASIDPKVYAWFQTQGDAWEAATTDPQPPEDVMPAFATWVQSLPAPRLFAASPVVFDAMWMDYYLKRFTRFGVVEPIYAEEKLFAGPALCIRSYLAATIGRPLLECAAPPADWLGGHTHTHRAIDDARGYAHALGVMMGVVRQTRATPA